MTLKFVLDAVTGFWYVPAGVVEAIFVTNVIVIVPFPASCAHVHCGVADPTVGFVIAPVQPVKDVVLAYVNPEGSVSVIWMVFAAVDGSWFFSVITYVAVVPPELTTIGVDVVLLSVMPPTIVFVMLEV